MSKEEYLELIRKHAGDAGESISLRQFCRATRMPEKHFVRFGFSSWNEAVAAAKLPSASFFRPRTPENQVVKAFTRLVSRLGKWPTENDMTLERQQDNTFPSLQVVRRSSQSGALARQVATFCEGKPDLVAVADLAAKRISQAAELSRTGRAHVEGYVYMMRSGRRYKIGRTTSPTRRHREVRLDLPDPTDLVHTIPTDDPPGIEEYWHRRFKDKRIRDTEFFELSGADVVAFKSRKYQ